ncbi:MAG: phage holin, LLH family [Oscillospiraceae bacterium]|nr:phage holin, LLH family [Oscillospiraceae bacterium]
MEVLKEWLTNYGGEIIGLILTGIITFLGTAAKRIFEKFANNREMREVVKDVVRSVEQMYKDIHGEEKLQKALDTASDILAEKGINITELELMTLIESAVSEFNDAFNKASWQEGIDQRTSAPEVAEETASEVFVE